MSINKNNLEKLIIIPVLARMGKKFNTQSAINLLLMTSAAESQLGTYLKQGLRSVDDGQALARGIYQMEPFTHNDVCSRFNFDHGIAKSSADRLIYDLQYATYLARACYWLIPKKLPDFDDVEGLAHYYAKYWYAGPHYDDRKQKAINAYNKYCAS